MKVKSRNLVYSIVCLVLISAVHLNAQVVANPPPDLEICENVEFQFQSDGFEFVDLTQQDVFIIGAQTDVSVTYFTSLQDAQTFNSPITQPGNYLTNTTEIFASLDDNNSSDYDITSFTVIIHIPPFVNASEAIVCDDEVLDGITEFTFEDDFKYFRSLQDAQNDINQLPETFSNLIPFNDQVYRRLDDVNGCFAIAVMFLEVSIEPVLTTPTALQSCGNNGVAVFDLTLKNEEIRENSQFYEFEYYYNNQIINNPTEFVNTTNPQVVEVLVQGTNSNSCSNIVSLELIVNEGENPEITNIPTQFLCPDDQGVFDLTSYENQLVSNTTDLSFTYYLDYVDMLLGNNPIADPNNFEIPLDGIIVFVAVENVNSNCKSYSTIKFDFLTNCQISCNAPVNITHCYGRGNKWFTFRSENGSPLILSFNAGSIHIEDDLYVVDSDGTVLYDDSGYTVGDPFINDISGLVFQSTGDLLRFQIQSRNNTSNNCEEGTGYIPWNFDVFCSDNVGQIQLQAFYDENNNGQLDTNEAYFNEGEFTYEINDDGNTTTVQTSTGQFGLFSFNDTDTYDLTFNLFTENENCFLVSPQSFENITASIGMSETFSFAVTDSQNCHDLSVSLINPSAPPRPGFNYYNTLNLENVGTTIISGSVEVVFDNQVSLLSTSTDSGYTISGTSEGFNLDFLDLNPGETISVFVNLNCSVSAFLGDIITNEANYVNAINDLNDENNTSTLVQEVVNSYDPNNKYESRGPQIVIDDFGTEDYLYYTINFQNLGNADAINVRIEDVLSPNLDPSTARMVSSSHDYVFEQTNNTLIWTFRNINLPSADQDFDLSQGYVSFKIKPNAGFPQVGRTILNSASIFFDFNSAINTNSFQTEFIEALSVDDFTAMEVKLFPNPAKDNVIIQFNSPSNDCDIEIYDLHGKLIKALYSNEQKELIIGVSDLGSGFYFIKLRQNQQAFTYKLLVR
ncbi:T9SS type A sorting domain-containing protein [Winogradskyella sp. DF17]|uniref:T9SS type A sorting domain-containing protein n=1 Tax=Winogradskyella pelagia TaxID=2819984 RepID=A0ABS3T1M6_9FLAO|nr:T9SS type A sorting domain-containing protein [Winogradskyella sp. DF17]MBO3116169.1 T9SS type A sorting domain-containing protein [Winogradskyella sp. DF17]